MAENRGFHGVKGKEFDLPAWACLHDGPIRQGETRPMFSSLRSIVAHLARRRPAGLFMVAALLLATPLLALGKPATAEQGQLGIPGGHGGLAATSEPLAAKVGARILRGGGNAVDAAAAVAFALNVIEPQSSGMGGGGFMMIHLAKSQETFVVDSRETAPAASGPRMFEDPAKPGEAIAWPLRSTSGFAVGVPGMVKGIATALDRWGTISLAVALAPAIHLAESGFLVTPRLEGSVTSKRLTSDPGVPAYEAARTVFHPGGKPLAENDLLVQPGLARTLRAIAKKGPAVVYTCGFDPANDIAQAIVDTQRATRATNPSGTGRMTCDDLTSYEVAIRQPVESTYRGYKMVSMPPPSSGGLTVIQILKLVEPFPMGDADRGFGFGSPKTLNVMIEAMRLAFADRALWMGDTDFVALPVKGLIDDRYIATRQPLIDPTARMSNDVAVAGDPRPFDMAALVGETKLARASLLDAEGRNTTHFTVADGDGNVVTYTNTIESAWGTGLMVPGFGFLLNNELTDFNRLPAANPDPDDYNPGANDAAPGKRPRSSMAPTMIFKDGKPLAAFGSPGGSSIINSVLNVTLNLIDHGMTVQEAVDAPRLSQTSAAGTPAREIGFDPGAIQALRDLGHKVRVPGAIGSVQAIVIDPHDKRQYGAADRRRTGGVVTLR